MKVSVSVDENGMNFDLSEPHQARIALSAFSSPSLASPSIIGLCGLCGVLDFITLRLANNVTFIHKLLLIHAKKVDIFSVSDNRSTPAEG